MVFLLFLLWLYPGFFSLSLWGFFCHYWVVSRAIWYFSRYEILFILKSEWHVSFARTQVASFALSGQHTHTTSFSHQTSASTTTFESSQWPLHSWVVRVTNGPLVWHQQYFFFFFFFLSSSIFTLNTVDFQSNPSICFSFRFDHCFLLLFVFF